MREIAIISGKGGTGKTSIVASFAALSQGSVLVDCDVDAADLHLLLRPNEVRRENFIGGGLARVKPGHCTACGKCEEICRFDAITFDGPGNGFVEKTFRVDPIRCEGCGVCHWFCTEDAIDFSPQINGEWFISTTKYGSMVHAKLGIAAENSGKLVSLIRSESKKLAEEKKAERIIIDGPPGIGCPVIAAITGVSLVVVISEPTLSGLHDLKRALELAKHFNIPAAACVNKWDINPEMTMKIEDEAKKLDAQVIGRIGYDPLVTKAQMMAKPFVEMGGNLEAEVREVWKRIS